MAKIGILNVEQNGKRHHSKKTKRLVLPVLFFLLLSLPTLVRGAYDPPNQMLGNPDLEHGAKVWVAEGGGIAAVEKCCGQHETPFWGERVAHILLVPPLHLIVTRAMDTLNQMVKLPECFNHGQ